MVRQQHSLAGAGQLSVLQATFVLVKLVSMGGTKQQDIGLMVCCSKPFTYAEQQ
jgi:hypothetical protein